MTRGIRGVKRGYGVDVLIIMIDVASSQMNAVSPSNGTVAL